MKIDLSDFSGRIANAQCDKAKEMSTPHIWFAWYPIQSGYLKWIWCEKVIRKYEENHYKPNWFKRRYENPSYEDYSEVLLRRLKNE